MSIEVGQKVLGKVTGITHFGAFVELPEKKTGLIHISEVSDSFVKDINTVLSVGQEIEVKILTISDDGKISLSARQAIDKPATEMKPKTFKPRNDKDNSGDFKPKPKFNKRPFEDRDEPIKTTSTNGNYKKSDDFDQLMSNFLKDSEDRLTSLRRNTEGKRGGRGGRRS